MDSDSSAIVDKNGNMKHEGQKTVSSAIPEKEQENITVVPETQQGDTSLETTQAQDCAITPEVEQEQWQVSVVPDTHLSATPVDVQVQVSVIAKTQQSATGVQTSEIDESAIPVLKTVPPYTQQGEAVLGTKYSDVNVIQETQETRCP